MKELEKNKTIIIICAIALILTILIVWLIGNFNNSEYEYTLSDKEFLRNYEVNEVIPVTIDDKKMAQIYLSEYVSLIFNDPQKAYELLDEDYKQKKYPTYESFTKYLDIIINDQFAKANVTKFDVKFIKGAKIYDLYDSSNNNFLFKETSIMNYTVLLDNYSI